LFEATLRKASNKKHSPISDARYFSKALDRRARRSYKIKSFKDGDGVGFIQSDFKRKMPDLISPQRSGSSPVRTLFLAEKLIDLDCPLSLLNFSEMRSPEVITLCLGYSFWHFETYTELWQNIAWSFHDPSPRFRRFTRVFCKC